MIYDDVSDEVKEVSNKVITLIAMKDRTEANECIVEYIKKTEHIYTVRDDRKTEMWIYKDGIYIQHGKTYVMEHCRRILKELYSTQLIKQIIEKIETETFIESKIFFKNTSKYELAIENGILNIQTQKIRDFTPKEIYFNKIPITYDKTKYCPNIIKFFDTTLKPEDIDIIQELFGYLLLKDYPINKAFMFSGAGRNGKGITISLMEHFVGEGNHTAIMIPELENDKYKVGELFGKLANLAGDINPTSLKNTRIFKSATTNTDTLTGSRKYLSDINFHNYAKMIFCANNMPKTYDDSDGFWDRWIFLEFLYKFVSQKEYDLLKTQKNQIEMENIRIADIHIIDKLTTKDELSGLLNWGLEGLDRLFNRRDFSYNKTIMDIKQMWTMKSDSLQVFINNYVEIDYDSKVIKDDFRKLYMKFCEKNKTIPVRNNVIKNALIEDMGVTEGRGSIDGKIERYWDGIILKEMFN